MELRAEFLRLLRESTLIQGSIALVFTLVIAYMAIVSVPVPSDIWTIYSLVIGFYFGAKSSQTTANTLREAMINIHHGEA